MMRQPLMHHLGTMLVAGVMAGSLVACSAGSSQETSPPEAAQETSPPEAAQDARPNIIFVLTDDQRFDALGFLDPALDTPTMDRMAREGVHFRNAFVTTSLCSPSRASILTGQYMHRHGIVDNNVGFQEGAEFFPAALRETGYETAFIGKWHMGGHTDHPQPGFDHWISFAGQGHYQAKHGDTVHKLNINGERVDQKGYITDELNGYAIDWLKERSGDSPYFLYLSHKAVHADFEPAERHQGQYADRDIPQPTTLEMTTEEREGKPLWVQNQRNSWHGVDFPYHSALDVTEYRRRYNETLSAVDEGLAEIFALLEERGELENTIVVLMGDNGFMFGEHGLIDKRNAYETSMRVPLLFAGGGVPEGQVVESVVANIDIAPTFLTLAGIDLEAGQYDGQSFAGHLRADLEAEDRDALLYEYYWEYNYPHTPTTFAVRTDRYKLIQYHGVWDTEELYDLENDPHERFNLIDDPELLDVKVALRAQLFNLLDYKGNGRPSVEFSQRFGPGAVLRHEDRSKAAEFPDRWLRPDNAPDRTRHTRNEGGRRKK